MKHKHVIAGLTCGFLLISGVCYSSAFYKQSTSQAVETTLSQEEAKPSPEAIALDQSNLDTQPEKVENDTLPSNTVKVGTKKLEDTNSSGSLIYVHLCGAVKKPGVYQAKEGARLIDFIELAGGLTEEAAGDYVNQAETITDGQRIYIPTKTELETTSAQVYIDGEVKETQAVGTDSQEKETQLLDINLATVEQLMELPGIGQAKADSIIEYRNTQGNFKVIEDLMNIPGIKEGVFNKISAYITIN